MMPALPRRADVVVPAVRDFVGRMGAATMLGSGRLARCTRQSSFEARDPFKAIVLPATLKRKKPRQMALAGL